MIPFESAVQSGAQPKCDTKEGFHSEFIDLKKKKNSVDVESLCKPDHQVEFWHISSIHLNQFGLWEPKSLTLLLFNGKKKKKKDLSLQPGADQVCRAWGYKGDFLFPCKTHSQSSGLKWQQGWSYHSQVVESWAWEPFDAKQGELECVCVPPWGASLFS